MEKKKILVAMSGGVDSSVTAALLKDEGHEVGGATIRTWLPEGCVSKERKACCGVSGLKDARGVADLLGIRHWVFNFEKEFKAYVIDSFASEYLRGRTPNPCILCNAHIKFRLFLDRARQLGFDFIATGHYAQIGYEPLRESYYILEGMDSLKDQSYVLFPLDQDVLRSLILPLGCYRKSEVRAKARQWNLAVMDKSDSQEICFVPDHDYGSFLEREYLRKELGMQNTVDEPRGVITTKDGKILGRHGGYFHYTRGQRRGLGVPYRERLYVIGTDPKKNEVIVGTRPDVMSQSCIVGNVQWFLRPEPHERLRIHVKIRSQHKKALAQVALVDANSVHVIFDDPQEAITPGQAAVFYEGSRVLGGGWIDQYNAP
ncbi:MAG: tRNA 2-thiouridine(34) synthase MnmA [Candidatus Omnitrophica bacterium]|nr:tRNA 2-thiouridine(34) synthase MnmA [Candidatus Omnitrophota bacterium]